jgi:hypothetical protein
MLLALSRIPRARGGRRRHEEPRPWPSKRPPVPTGRKPKRPATQGLQRSSARPLSLFDLNRKNHGYPDLGIPCQPFYVPGTTGLATENYRLSRQPANAQNHGRHVKRCAAMILLGLIYIVNQVRRKAWDADRADRTDQMPARSPPGAPG